MTDHTPRSWMYVKHDCEGSLEDEYGIYSSLEGEAGPIALVSDESNARLVAVAPEMLEVCEATCSTIEFRGKSFMASYDGLYEDESNWRDGVEPYLLTLYEKARAVIIKARGK